MVSSMKVNCPTCKTELEWSKENIYRPFCCKRCQLIDLGEWADENKRIKGESVDPAQLNQNKTIYFD